MESDKLNIERMFKEKEGAMRHLPGNFGERSGAIIQQAPHVLGCPDVADLTSPPGRSQAS